MAKIISIILQPILIPLYGIIMLLCGDDLLQNLTISSKIYIVLIIFVTTCFVPAAVVVTGMKMDKIHDEFIQNRRERTWPYLFSLLGYVLGIAWLWRTDLPLFYIAPVIGSAISIIFTLSINFRWKISAHLCAMGGLAGGIFAYSFLTTRPMLALLSLVIILSGIVGWSRMLLKAHTLGQVCCGWLLGFITVAAAWILIIE